MGVDVRGLFRHGDDGKEQPDWMQDDVTVIEGTVVEKPEAEEPESTNIAADEEVQTKFCKKCGAELPTGARGKRCEACKQDMKDKLKAVGQVGLAVATVALGAAGMGGKRKGK
ncbi:hypothetical protein [Bifidobacterium cuniculi]|uniref:Uncharacterized protein n=1 Tax=Bifidobacterium cuniculi TaxID=1688 RepID=A0A087ATH7_9BIFI|nr:hypothetical protein [Bifidobacterium cuniculi]KFI62077.1 hypothetical protein BCUN_1393 [Bifidobacterium cuniculi]